MYSKKAGQRYGNRVVGVFTDPGIKFKDPNDGLNNGAGYHRNADFDSDGPSQSGVAPKNITELLRKNASATNQVQNNGPEDEGQKAAPKPAHNLAKLDSFKGPSEKINPNEKMAGGNAKDIANNAADRLKTAQGAQAELQEMKKAAMAAATAEPMKGQAPTLFGDTLEGLAIAAACDAVMPGSGAVVGMATTGLQVAGMVKGDGPSDPKSSNEVFQKLSQGPGFGAIPDLNGDGQIDGAEALAAAYDGIADAIQMIGDDANVGLQLANSQIDEMYKRNDTAELEEAGYTVEVKSNHFDNDNELEADDFDPAILADMPSFADEVSMDADDLFEPEPVVVSDLEPETPSQEFEGWMPSVPQHRASFGMAA